MSKQVINKQLGFGSIGVDGFGTSVKVILPENIKQPVLPDLDNFAQSGMTVAVSVSGGADSQECANIALDRFGFDNVRLVHAMVELPETPPDELLWEIEENIKHLQYLESIWGKPIERVIVFNPNRSGHKPKEMLEASEDEFQSKVVKMAGLTQIVLNNQYMPGSGMAYCTESKSLALERWARQFDAHKFLHIWGQRAEESKRRARMPEYGLSEFGRYVWRPLHKWTKEQVRESIANRGQEINPVYLGPEESRLGRGGNCMFCINLPNWELRKAVKLYPRQATLFVEKIENVVGPRRDYSVAQAIKDAALEQQFPNLFAESNEFEASLPRKSCGIGNGFGCDD